MCLAKEHNEVTPVKLKSVATAHPRLNDKSFKMLYAANYSQRDTLIMKSLGIFDERNPSKTTCEKMLNMENCWNRLGSRKNMPLLLMVCPIFLKGFFSQKGNKSFNIKFYLML